MNGYKERTTLQGNSFTNRIRANNMTRQCIIRDLNYCICKDAGSLAHTNTGDVVREYQM